MKNASRRVRPGGRKGFSGLPGRIGSRAGEGRRGVGSLMQGRRWVPVWSWLVSRMTIIQSRFHAVGRHDGRTAADFKNVSMFRQFRRFQTVVQFGIPEGLAALRALPRRVFRKVIDVPVSGSLDLNMTSRRLDETNRIDGHPALPARVAAVSNLRTAGGSAWKEHDHTWIHLTTLDAVRTWTRFPLRK